MINRVIALAVLAISLAGCVAQQYWIKPGVGMQQTATDLYACRQTGVNAGYVYSAMEMEQPCMVSKGYALSSSPPALP